MTFFNNKENYSLQERDNEIFLVRTNGREDDLTVSVTKMYGIGQEPDDVETVLKDLSVRPRTLWAQLWWAEMFPTLAQQIV